MPLPITIEAIAKLQEKIQLLSAKMNKSIADKAKDVLDTLLSDDIYTFLTNSFEIADADIAKLDTITIVHFQTKLNSKKNVVGVTASNLFSLFSQVKTLREHIIAAIALKTKEQQSFTARHVLLVASPASVLEKSSPKAEVALSNKSEIKLDHEALKKKSEQIFHTKIKKIMMETLEDFDRMAKTFNQDIHDEITSASTAKQRKLLINKILFLKLLH